MVVVSQQILGFFFISNGKLEMHDLLQEMAFEIVRQESVGNSDGDVLIFAHRRQSTLTQYFTWFGKTAYIHGRESLY
jgi:hypothetical protein